MALDRCADSRLRYCIRRRLAESLSDLDRPLGASRREGTPETVSYSRHVASDVPDSDYERRVREGLELQKGLPRPRRGYRQQSRSEAAETANAVADMGVAAGIAGLAVSGIGVLLAWLIRRRPPE